MSKPTVLNLSRQEILDQIDRQAQLRLCMSGKEFLFRYRTGGLKNLGEVADLIALANLLEEDDPLFVAA